MRIISWNIRAGGGRRVNRIAESIERWRGDVVALTEFRATPPSCLLKDLLGKQGLTFQVSTAGETRAAVNSILLASRWPLRTVRVVAAPAEPGRWCLAQIGSSTPFMLGAMHVPNRVSGRKYPFHAAVLNVVHSWRRGPALLAGDTNSGRIGLDEEVPCFNKREDGWLTALDAAGWRDAYRHVHGEAREYTWFSPNGRNGFRLDQAFINRSLLPRLVDARYAWACDATSTERRDAVSDHAALIVELNDDAGGLA